MALSRLALTVVLVLCPALVAPAAAQTAGGVFTVKTPGMVATSPLPAFARSGGAEEYVNAGGGARPWAIHELIPKGESFEAWSTLFAGLLEENLNQDMSAYVNTQFGVYANACGSTTDMFRLFRHDGTAQDNRERILFSILCPAYNDSPDRGEVMVMMVVRQGRDYVRFYQHWRGPAFDPDTPQGWPRPEPDALRDFLEIYDAARLTGQDGKG